MGPYHNTNDAASFDTSLLPKTQSPISKVFLIDIFINK